MGRVDHFLVVRGAQKSCAHDDEIGEPDEIVSAADSPQIVRMPCHYWNGFGLLGDRLTTRIHFINRLYNHANPDEKRRPWNDQTILVQGDQADR